MPRPRSIIEQYRRMELAGKKYQESQTRLLVAAQAYAKLEGLSIPQGMHQVWVIVEIAKRKLGVNTKCP